MVPSAWIVALILVAIAMSGAALQDRLGWEPEFTGAMTGALFGAAATLVGVLIDRELSRVDETRAATARVESIKRAMLAEIQICGEMAKTFSDARIAAPLYRLPISSFQIGLHELAVAGALGGDDAKSLMQFYSEVETLNRGLDQAADLTPPGSAVGTATEAAHNRNLLKAERIRSPDGQYHVTASKAAAS